MVPLNPTLANTNRPTANGTCIAQAAMSEYPITNMKTRIESRKENGHDLMCCDHVMGGVS